MPPKLYAYTNVFNGKSYSGTLGQFSNGGTNGGTTRNGFRNACPDAGDALYGDGGAVLESENCQDPSYDDDEVKFGKHEVGMTGYDQIYWKLKPSENTVIMNECKLGESGGEGPQGQPFFYDKGSYTICDLNSTDSIQYHEDGPQAGDWIPPWVSGSDRGTATNIPASGPSTPIGNNYCQLRCEYNLDDFKLQSALGSGAQEGTRPGSCWSIFDYPTASDATKIIPDIDLGTKNINCPHESTINSEYCDSNVAASIRAGATSCGIDTTRENYYIPEHSLWAPDSYPLPKGMDWPEVEEGGNPDFYIHNRNVPMNIKNYGEKFFPPDANNSIYDSWTVGKLMKDLCKTVEYDSDYCPEGQDFCSYFETSRPSLLIGSDNPQGGNYNICLEWLDHVKEPKDLKEATPKDANSPSTTAEILPELAIKAESSTPDKHQWNSKDKNNVGGEWHLSADDLMVDYDNVPWVISEFGRGRGQYSAGSTRESYKLWYNAEEALKGYCDSIYSEFQVGESDLVDTPLDPLCGCYKRDNTRDWHDFKTDLNVNGGANFSGNLGSQSDVCLYSHGFKQCNDKYVIKPQDDQTTLNLLTLDRKFSFTPFLQLQEEICHLPECMNTVNQNQQNVRGDAEMTMDNITQECTIINQYGDGRSTTTTTTTGTCNRPDITTGYNITETSLNQATFDVTVTCAEGYSGHATVIPCSQVGEDYVLGGNCTMTTETNAAATGASASASATDRLRAFIKENILIIILVFSLFIVSIIIF